MGYCGYIDILGTKDLAESALDDLRSHLEWFHTSIQDSFAEYKNGKCFAASDGAFFANRDFEDFYPFYQRIRNHLFDKGVFFKCSYIGGDIVFLTEQVPAVSDNAETRFLSLNFFGSASRAYRAEAQLKGIGCKLADFQEKKGTDQNTVENFFLEKIGNQYVAKKFVDFAFTKYEIGCCNSDAPTWNGEQPLLDQIFFHASAASMESDYVAAKYIPLFINAIRSSDFTRVQLTEDGWKSAPKILEMLVGSRAQYGGIKKLPGMKFVVLALYDKLVSDCDGECDLASEKAIVKHILTRRDCQSNLGQIPTFVMQSRVRKRLIAATANIRKLPRPNQKG